MPWSRCSVTTLGKSRDEFLQFLALLTVAALHLHLALSIVFWKLLRMTFTPSLSSAHYPLHCDIHCDFMGAAIPHAPHPAGKTSNKELSHPPVIGSPSAALQISSSPRCGSSDPWGLQLLLRLIHRITISAVGFLKSTFMSRKVMANDRCHYELLG